MNQLEAKAREVVGADAIKKSKGDLVFMLGFFYRMGMDDEKYAKLVSDKLTKAGIPHTIIDHYEQWKDFRGGDSVAKGSHWGVKVRINP